MDAPYHFPEQGKTMDQIDLLQTEKRILWKGPCTIIKEAAEVFCVVGIL